MPTMEDVRIFFKEDRKALLEVGIPWMEDRCVYPHPTGWPEFFEELGRMDPVETFRIGMGAKHFDRNDGWVLLECGDARTLDERAMAEWLEDFVLGDDEFVRGVAEGSVKLPSGILERMAAEAAGEGASR